MFTKKHNLPFHMHLDGGLLTGGVGKALVIAALLTSAVAPAAHAGGTGCSPAGAAGGSGCVAPPDGSIHPSGAAAAAAEKTLYSFGTWFAPEGTYPHGTLFRDAGGALYRATMASGAYGKGTIFKLTPPAKAQPNWRIVVLHAFSGGVDSVTPNADLVMGSAGVLYGTTDGDGSYVHGTVFKLTPPRPGSTTWTHTVLHTFAYDWVNGNGDGDNPYAGVVFGPDGALYGTTCLGGSTADPSGTGYGTVFKLTPPPSGRTNWTEKVLYRFTGGADGDCPTPRSQSTAPACCTARLSGVATCRVSTTCTSGRVAARSSS